MRQIDSLFYELIRVAIGTQDSLSRLPQASEWGKLYKMAQKQSLVGVCFAGLQRLRADADEGFARIGISEEVYYDWLGNTFMIQQKNGMMDKYTKDALAFVRNKDVPCQVLKGQGIAKLYTSTGSPQGKSLAELRQSGDIDVWIRGGKDKAFALSKEVLGKVKGLTNYHIHFPIYKDAEIELHFKPSFLSSPIRNRKFLKFCKLYEPYVGCNDEPSLEFNRIYILLHCYRHLCGHGVGMRQLLDYYYVLLQGFTEEEKADSMKWISALGMKKFAEAMMWFMQNIFGLEAKYLLCSLNEDAGRFLLNEVMHSGNMGHGEDRFDGKIGRNAMSRYLYNLKRDLRLLQFCPYEALWDPFYNVYQFVWCKVQNKKS